MAKYNSLDNNNPVKQTIENAKRTFMQALKRNLEKGALYAGAMFLGTLMLYNSGMYAEAAAPVDTPVSIEQTVAADTLDNTTGSVTDSTASKLSKAVQFKVTINRDNARRTVKAAKTSSKVKKANSTKIKNALTKSVTVNGIKISLGMSTSQIESALASYGAPVYRGAGCQSYNTECLYYQKNGSETSFMFEFYNGALERVIFSSPKWTMGKMTAKTNANTLPLTGKSYKTTNGTVSAKKYSVSKGKVSFTAYLDGMEKNNKYGWYMCELRCTGVNHSGTNQAASQKVSEQVDQLSGLKRGLLFDLDNYELNSSFTKRHKGVTLDMVKKAYANMTVKDMETGRQNVYLTNMYRAYHGLELAAFSIDTTEYAFVNASARALAKEEFHADFFNGEFKDTAANNTIFNTRVNEWWGGWQDIYSENCGYEGGATPLSVLTGTVASAGHRDNILNGNFAMGAAIVNGYDTVETLAASLMDEDEIQEAQEKFVKQYNIGISASEVSAALYTDTYSVFTYDNLYWLAKMNKEQWVDATLKKFGLQDIKGAKEYVGIKYDEYYHELGNYVYSGYHGFMGVYTPWVKRGNLTEAQLEEVYVYFCNLEYDKEYTQALMNHFGCTAEQVYLEHSDVMAALSNIAGTDNEIIAEVNSIASKYELSVSLTAEMYVRAHTLWSTKLANETRAMFGLAPVYTENRLK